MEVLKWLREHGRCPWDETCENAVDGGHLDILKWSRQNNCPWDRWS